MYDQANKYLLKVSEKNQKKSNRILWLLRVLQPITRTELAGRLALDKSTITEKIKPLITSGVIKETVKKAKPGKRLKYLTFAENGSLLLGVNLGVRRTQVGVADINGKVYDELEFETPKDAVLALARVKEAVDSLFEKHKTRGISVIGVSVPGVADAAGQKLVYAPNLGWRNIEIASKLSAGKNVRVLVDNDAAAAAMYEAKRQVIEREDGLFSNFILVRSGTGIGIGLVINGELYRGTEDSRGAAGEFGHMTIVAGGRQCVCGNKGCWEQYASAASAAALYRGNRMLRESEQNLRFADIALRAKNGERRAQSTLEKIGEYLGIGIANVMMGLGISKVIISGRLVYAWEFIEKPLKSSISKSIVGKTQDWSVIAGSPVGSAIGGALELAANEFLNSL